jgi:hypothetical protein
MFQSVSVQLKPFCNKLVRLPRVKLLNLVIYLLVKLGAYIYLPNNPAEE